MREQKDMQAAKVYDGLDGYCPTVGIIGAVMGLIHVMGNLADPSKLELGRLSGESSAAGLNPVQPWAEAPAVATPNG